MAAAPRSLSGKRKRKLGGASGGKRRAGQERELAELAQLEAENAALLAAAAPQVDGLRRTAAIAWERTLRATGSDPIERQLRDALRSYAAVLEVLPQDAEATQRQSALCRRLRELAKEAPMQHQKRKHTVAVSASATDSAAAGVPAVNEIKKLTVADIREIAARAKAEMRPSADLGGGTGDGTDAGTVAAPTTPEAQLSSEQEQAFDAICSGQNVFITGPAGTGKSLVLGRAVAALRAAGKHVQVTAPTGVAAELVGGTTIHAMCGFGVPKTVTDFNKMLFTDTKERLQHACDVLVIDEVSMLSGELLDRIDELLRRLRTRAGQPTRPFGGIQLVLLGDFYQLSPIVERREGRLCPHLFLNRGFAFQSAAWLSCNLQCYTLSHVFRQDESQASFVAALHRVRRGGVIDEATRQLLNSTVGRRPRVVARDQVQTPATLAQDSSVDGECAPADPSQRQPVQAALEIEPTKLFCTNLDVDRRNAIALARLHTRSWWGKAHDWVEADAPALMKKGQTAIAAAEQNLKEKGSLWRSCRMGTSCELKVGAQVMMCVNHDVTPDRPENMLVNGSRGVVIGWAEKAVCTKLRTSILREARVYEKLASTLPSQTAEQSDALHHAKERRRRAAWITGHGNTLPVVRFANGRTDVVGPHTFESTVPGTGRCCRIQLPLRLAWCLTIHKSQGLSLDSVQLDLSDAFAAGQVYVALSRVRTLDGLELLAPLRAGTRIATSTAVAAYEAAFAPTAKIQGLPQRRCLSIDDLQALGGGWWQQHQPTGSPAAEASVPPRVCILAGSRRCSLGAQQCLGCRRGSAVGRSGMYGRTILNQAGAMTLNSASGTLRESGAKHKCRMCVVCGIYSGVHLGC